MILITVGSSVVPFDRLVTAADGLTTTEQVLVQTGASALRPERAEWVEFLPHDELVDAMRTARVVVAHAGAGSTMMALSHGVRPILVPRLARYGEAVDDHQLHFARRFAEQGLVEIVEDVTQLQAAIDASAERTHASAGQVTPLVSEVASLLESAVADRAGRRRR